MSQHNALPNLGLELFTKRRRVNIACVHCRRRKVKCSTSDASASAPCGRCSKMGLSCTYVPVAAQYGDSSSPVGERGEFSKLRHSSTSSPTTHFHETHLNSLNLPTHNERRSSATKDEPVEIQLPPFEHGFADDLFNSNLPDHTSWDFPHPLQPACSTPFLPNYIPNQPYGADCRPHLSSYPVDPRCLPSPLDLYHGYVGQLFGPQRFEQANLHRLPQFPDPLVTTLQRQRLATRNWPSGVQLLNPGPICCFYSE